MLSNNDVEEALKATFGPQPRSRMISSRLLPIELDEGRCGISDDGSKVITPRAAPLSLRSLCLRVAALNIATHVLPLGLDKPIEGEEELHEKAKNGPNGAGFILDKARGPARKATDTKPRRRPQAGLFSYDESADKDYRESGMEEKRTPRRGTSRRTGTRSALGEEDDGLKLTAHERWQRQWGLRSTKEFWHLRNSYLLRGFLHPRAYVELQQALLELNPACLTQHILATYFVMSREAVHLSSSIDVVSNNPSWPATLLSLILAPGSANENSLTHAAVDIFDEDEPLAKTLAVSAPQQALRNLRLEGLTRLSTNTLSGFFKRYNAAENLTALSLAGCVSVGVGAMRALVQCCGKTLESINVNFTDIGAAGLEEIIQGCGAQLKELECCNVEGLDDQSVPALLARCIQAGASSSPPVIPLANLRKLWVRKTAMGDVALSSLLKVCVGSIESLNLENTEVAQRGNFTLLGMALGLPGFEADNGSESSRPTRPQARLTELYLSKQLCWPPSFGNFIRGVCHAKDNSQGCRLRTLVLEDMSMALSHPDSARKPLREHGLSAEALEAVRQALLPTIQTRLNAAMDRNEGQTCVRPLMERVSLQDNARLGSRSGAVGRGTDFEEAVMHRFVRDVGRYCRVLDLGGIALGPEDLPFAPSTASSSSGFEENAEGAVNSRGYPATVQELLLNAELRAETVAVLPEGCRALKYLNLAGSIAETEVVEHIVHRNNFLTELDLTLCRGVARAERRAFFDVSLIYLSRGTCKCSLPASSNLQALETREDA